MKIKHTLLVLPVAIATLLTAQAAVVTIYEDNFSGLSSDPLTGTTPDVTTGGNTWTAATGFFANGLSDQAGMATLPFTPTSGFIYTLAFSIALPTGQGNDWLGAGFGTGANLSGEGSGWLLKRSDPFSGLNIDRAGGLGTGNYAQVALLNNDGTATNFEIVLNTTNDGAWTVAWYGNSSQLGSTFTYGANPTITYIGFQNIGGSVDGTYSNMSLTSIPEPSTAALAIAAGIGTLLLRRRNHAR